MTSADNASSRRDIALDWLLRVQQAPHDEQVREGLAQWCAADPANAQAYGKAERVWRLTGQVAPTTQTQWPKAEVVELRPKRRRYWLGAAMAACLMLAVAPSLSVRLQSDYRTAQGETRAVTLADGSVVQLDSDSALAVAYAGDRRDVRLLRGQAFFKVMPDKSRPFHVRAEAVEVTVTGTAFNVELGRQVSVAVQEGSVKVDDWRKARALAQALKPGDRLVVAENGQAQQGRVVPGQVAAWRNGQVIADDRPIGEVVEELRRYVPGVVVLRDEALAGKRVTGVYDLRKPLAALKAVVQPHGGSVESFSPWIITLSAAPRSL